MLRFMVRMYIMGLSVRQICEEDKKRGLEKLFSVILE